VALLRIAAEANSGAPRGRRGHDAAVDAAELAGLLAEPDRLRVVAALALGASTREQVRTASGLDQRGLHKALARLEGSGLIEADGDAVMLRWEQVKKAARVAAHREPEDHGTGSTEVEAVLRRFLRDGRVVQLPMGRGKRLMVLDHVSMAFELGIRYSEKEVNTILRAFHDDYAALRRYLVDEGFLSREAGEYWRSGGTFHP
jgi:hypothetical protein